MQTTLGLALAVTSFAAQDPQPTPAPASRGPVVDTRVDELPGGAGGLEVDREGNLYAGDFGERLGPGGAAGARVHRVTPDGEVSVFLGGLVGASGNAFGPDGSFYQSNIGVGTITRVAPDGTTSVFARGLSSPVGIAVDEEGTLFVANCGSGSIVAITQDGEREVFATSPLLACPNGLALDEDHNLYVSNFNDGGVLRISWSGEVTKLATLPGENNGHLVVHDGALLVVARGAHRIFRVTFDGEVTPFAGSGERGKSDGPALEATFSFPNDLGVSPDGKTLYVNENASTTADHSILAPARVRRIRLQ